ncbi:MAG: helix-turn-helix transcriptional regulator [Novosphingobium sp.]
MSPASFHRHFRAATTMTPIQFQKQIRLQTARRMLLSQGQEVAAIGYSIGYESPSQFNRDYRRLFGVPPGRDGAAIRDGLLFPAEI